VKLRFTQRAAGDLRRLRAFIAKDNPQAARRLSWALRGSIQRLVDQSRMGQVLGTPAGVRRWVAGPYVVLTPSRGKPAQCCASGIGASSMNIGPVPASLQRAIGHELGHTLGTGDDGPGMMNNVNLNENPIATQLGEPYYRVRY
jgi:toxin ParE1/3/4